MKKIRFYNIVFIATILLFSIGCSKNKGINDYSEELKINFPENMDLVHYNVFSDSQDYSIQSIYKLSFNEKNALLEEVYFKICDSSSEEGKHYSCWRNCEDYYSYEYQNKDVGVEIKIVFVAQNDVRTLSIYEYKI